MIGLLPSRLIVLKVAVVVNGATTVVMKETPEKGTVASVVTGSIVTVTVTVSVAVTVSVSDPVRDPESGVRSPESGVRSPVSGCLIATK